jgi:HSP20 family protein
MTQVIKKEENHAVSTTEALISSENAHRPHTNIYHTPEAYIFEIELPGVSNEGIDLEITEKNVLVLKARNAYIQDSDKKVLVSQVRTGNFYRAFELGEQIDRDSVSAQLELGVLTVQIAKQEKARPRRIVVSG